MTNVPVSLIKGDYSEALHQLMKACRNLEANCQKMIQSPILEDENAIEFMTLPPALIESNLEFLELGYQTVDTMYQMFLNYTSAAKKQDISVPSNNDEDGVINNDTPPSLARENIEEEEEEEEVHVNIHDIKPVYGEEAIKLNQQVTRRIEVALRQDTSRIQLFKKNALRFGNGETTADDFYAYCCQSITNQDILDDIVVDFARLLTLDDRRIPLLEAHAANHERPPSPEPDVVGNTPVQAEAPPQYPNVKSINTEPQYPNVKSTNTFPSELHLEPLNHLMFIIHGIGQHTDFRDGEFKSWDGNAGLEGGNHAFRDTFRTMINSQFKDIPLSLELQSIEWHDDLHETTGIDEVFDMVCPDGLSGVREFNKNTLMDVLYYLSPHFGQLIVNRVTEELNTKYQVFMDEHPGWKGQISIFAHSLGSVITYDILTHERGSRSNVGVEFTGLDFSVENFFAAGSPVPVFLLSRGDLKIKDGNFQSDIKMPKCNHYYNLYHPIDPIAYRIEPLIKPDMRSSPAVQLITAQHVKELDFKALHTMYEKNSTPAHGQSRIDHVLRRRRREEMMEMAYVKASHSSYWSSDDVVLFTLMKICRPITDHLATYTRAERPLPKTLSRPRGPLSVHSRVCHAGLANLREPCTGFWTPEEFLILTPKWLFVFHDLADVVCKSKGEIELNGAAVAEYGEDSCTMTLTVNQITTSLRASTSEVRNAWLHDLRQVIQTLSCSNDKDKPKSDTEVSCSAKIPKDVNLNYFGARRAGMLSKKGDSVWIEGWKSRWFVLDPSGVLRYYDAGPTNLEPSVHVKVSGAAIQSFRHSFLFRLLQHPRGTAVEFRVRDIETFDCWVDHFGQIQGLVMHECTDLVSRSPAAGAMMMPALLRKGKRKSSSNSLSCAASAAASSNLSPQVQIRIEGYRILQNEKRAQGYAAYVVNVKHEGSPPVVVLRRFSEFRALHHQLRNIFPHDQVPGLPSTRLWNKFDPKYLKAKSVLLQGYLCRVYQLTLQNRGYPVLMEFLTDPKEVSSSVSNDHEVT